LSLALTAYILQVYRLMPGAARSKIFWSGGSQALRIPKEMRLAGTEVMIRKQGNALVVEAIPEEDDWEGFWDDLLPLARPVRRHAALPVEKRKPL
jgi:virulence-associated protein VagC